MHTHAYPLIVLATALMVGCSSAPSHVNALTGNDDVSSQNLVMGGGYTIRVGQNRDKCLVPTSGATVNGTLLTVADCDGTAEQTWVRGGTNRDMLVLAGKCLDVVDGATDNGTKLQMWDCVEANTNQRWRYVGGQLNWLGQTKCLDLTDGVTSSGTQMQIWDCDADNDNQQWAFVESKTAQAANANGVADANTVGNANQAASPNAVVAAPVYTALDLTGVTAATRSGTQSVVSLGATPSCMAVVSQDAGDLVQTAACDNAATGQFVFDGNGHISFPAQDLTLRNTKYYKGTYCLTAVGAPVLRVCNSGDANQLWGQSGNVLVSVVNRTCLTVDSSAANPSGLKLTACTTNPQQAWNLRAN